MFQKVDHEGSLGVKSWWQRWRQGSTERAIALARGRARTGVRTEGGNGYHTASVPGAGWSPAPSGGGSSRGGKSRAVTTTGNVTATWSSGKTNGHNSVSVAHTVPSCCNQTGR